MTTRRFGAPRRSRDPVAPVRRRPRRVAKKLERRVGMLRCRGWSYVRMARHVHAMGMACAKALNRMAAESHAAPAPGRVW